uniref:Secreted protein n=1 Tax=Rhipicephalus appendiculatus TaxID=34631 RepID=A0A131YDJ6_RHIAP
MCHEVTCCLQLLAGVSCGVELCPPRCFSLQPVSASMHPEGNGFRQREVCAQRLAKHLLALQVYPIHRKAFAMVASSLCT